MSTVKLKLDTQERNLMVLIGMMAVQGADKGDYKAAMKQERLKKFLDFYDLLDRLDSIELCQQVAEEKWIAGGKKGRRPRTEPAELRGEELEFEIPTGITSWITEAIRKTFQCPAGVTQFFVTLCEKLGCRLDDTTCDLPVEDKKAPGA